MILSVSRRTDVPAFYGEWLINRLREGFVLVRNPVNPKQVGKILLSRENIDCIVFWTKNPENFMKYLGELEEYPFYFQFTLNGYGKDIEPGMPDKKKELVPLFQELSEKIGNERVIWRYDPVLISKNYPVEWHIDTFESMAAALEGYTKQAVISFLDMYRKISRRMTQEGIRRPTEEEVFQFAQRAGNFAGNHGMTAVTCAEHYDLSGFGIRPSSCIDRGLVEKLIGMKISVDKDKNQRPECGCAESIDIGSYDTCPAGCLYCYAGHSREFVNQTLAQYRPDAPMLCGETDQFDKIKERKAESCAITQLSFFQGSTGGQMR